jgi:hypothetical protein
LEAVSVRRRYATGAQLDRHRAIRAKLAGLLGAKPMRLPGRVNSAFKNNEGETVAFADVRSRSQAYYEIMVDARTWEALQEFSLTGVPTFVIVEIPTGIYGLDVKGIRPRFGIGGRADRGDPSDRERCAYLPFHLFERLTDGLGD